MLPIANNGAGIVCRLVKSLTLLDEPLQAGSLIAIRQNLPQGRAGGFTGKIRVEGIENHVGISYGVGTVVESSTVAVLPVGPVLFWFIPGDLLTIRHILNGDELKERLAREETMDGRFRS